MIKILLNYYMKRTSRKWPFQIAELKKYASQHPNVCFVIVGIALTNFGRNVIRSSQSRKGHTVCFV